jgi:putative FmdB family regulatory protein
MPTYEYACRDCEDHLEVVQSFKDRPLTECPRCGGKLRKVFGNIGISFKGSGFYKTDSRAASSASKNGASADSKSEAKAESKAEAKSDSKSESSKSSKSDSSGGSERKTSKSSSGEAKAAAS